MFKLLFKRFISILLQQHINSDCFNFLIKLDMCVVYKQFIRILNIKDQT